MPPMKDHEAIIEACIVLIRDTHEIQRISQSVLDPEGGTEDIFLNQSTINMLEVRIDELIPDLLIGETTLNSSLNDVGP